MSSGGWERFDNLRNKQLNQQLEQLRLLNKSLENKNKKNKEKIEMYVKENASLQKKLSNNEVVNQLKEELLLANTRITNLEENLLQKEQDIKIISELICGAPKIVLNGVNVNLSNNGKKKKNK